jgi:peptide-methionine (S)-S-oxide reductase|tara:strand:+ start:61 stop:690 length:630 start_codon:yes stop_codon:yes gene_type:complete
MMISRFIFLAIFSLLSCGGAQEKTMPQENSSKMKTATFGAGCFWCVEAVYERLEGVGKVISGYSGGKTQNPTYDEICSGDTGHAEVCQIEYDPKVISFESLLSVFWQTHDPTTLNRQGNDIGTQYRSAIFFHDPQQEKLAQEYKEKLNKSGAWKNPIVTEIVPLGKFYTAENYHQGYYDRNPNQGYCAFVIAPKIEKLKKVFGDKLKKK